MLIWERIVHFQSFLLRLLFVGDYFFCTDKLAHVRKRKRIEGEREREGGERGGGGVEVKAGLMAYKQDSAKRLCCFFSYLFNALSELMDLYVLLHVRLGD